MPSTTIELDKALADARRRRAEAQDLYDHPLATDLDEAKVQCDKLLAPMTAMGEKIDALQAVRDEAQASQVVLDDVTPEEIQQIETALQHLDKAIRRTETFEANLALLTAALGAVTTLTSAAKRRRPPRAGGAAEVTPAIASLRVDAASVPAVAGRRRGRPAITGPFVCYAPHHEDLTQRVLEALDDDVETPGIRLITLTKKKVEVETRTIAVKCSEGHLNVFEIPVESA